MEITIVTTKEQRKDAYDVRKKVFVEEQNVPIEIEIDEYEDEATHFVLYDHKTPVAAGRIRFLPPYCKVERICVLKPYRKTGVGQKLMTAIEQFAIKQGFTKFKLNAQVQAENFYKKLGYETISDEFLDAGIPHVTMVKDVEK